MYNDYDSVVFNENNQIDPTTFNGEILKPFFYYNTSFVLRDINLGFSVSVSIFTSVRAYEYLFYSADAVYNLNKIKRPSFNSGFSAFPLPEYMVEQIDRRVSILSLMD